MKPSARSPEASSDRSIRTGEGKPTLSPPELEALWELASSENESLRMRFLEEAIRNPLMFSQLRARSEPALIASLGLDPDRKSKTIEMLSRHLHDPGISLTTRASVAFLLLELENQSGSLIEEAVAVIVAAFRTKLPENIAISFELKAIPLESTHHTKEIANLYIAALEQAGSDRGYALADGLVSFSARLGPAEAIQVARDINDAIERTAGGYACSTLADSLVKITSRFSPGESALACKRAAHLLAEAIERKEETTTRSTLAKDLVAVSARLGPEDAARACGPAARRLADAIGRAKNAEGRSTLAVGLAKVSTRLDPEERGTGLRFGGLAARGRNREGEVRE